MPSKTQRLIALALAFALLASPSTFADVSQLEKDMARVFGGRARVATTIVANDSAGAILDAMNRERAAHGLHPLRLNAALSEAASDRVGDMFAKRYFAHVSPDGIDPFVWAARRGYRYRLIGENLAVGYAGTRVVDGWMRSPGHRENILQRGFDEVGIAIAAGAPQRGYKGPTVVAMYGRR